MQFQANQQSQDTPMPSLLLLHVAKFAAVTLSCDRIFAVDIMQSGRYRLISDFSRNLFFTRPSVFRVLSSRIVYVLILVVVRKTQALYVASLKKHCSQISH
jgi:hypothetical protein